MSVLLFLLTMLVGSATCQDLPMSYDLRSAQREEGAEGCPTTQELRESIHEDILKLINNSVLSALSLDGQQRVCDCGGAGWKKVAYLNMSDANHNCPPEWSLFTNPRRLCGRPALYRTAYVPCKSAIFPTSNMSYSHVCGRVIGYQYRDTEVFLYENLNYTLRISDAYVDGVSLTYGEPRRHIWSFAAALDELNYSSGINSRCPCTSPSSVATRTPSFVGNDYFCETGVPPDQRWVSYKHYSDDPLWDGEGCGPTSTCCSFNNPPWFCKQLPQSTNADLEMRLCGAGTDENTLIEQVEIFIK